MKARIVIVTGAFGALGRVVAETLETGGARVVRVDAAPELPPFLRDRPQDGLIQAGVDLTDEAATQAMATRVVALEGAIDGLVNIAGGFRWETVSAGDAATWDRMHALNLKTALNTCMACLPHLLARPEGRIVNIGAAAAAKAGAGMGAYAASKSAVLRLTEALADETKERGLTVNAVLPGIIDTPANRAEMPGADASRWVSPQALADVVAFLLSDGARAITGAGIPVTGRL
ncbi:MAG: SDR family NAD(P)-dependent oxidoreductase [Burkholderiaceae bacterium]|jgi:NAD(P)-dependent dehydrogenase (short-subunit alcohol dehydrogenase family)